MFASGRGGAKISRPAPPVFAVPRFFLRGPALYPEPCPGPRFLRGTVWGPTIASQFHTANANFRRMLSDKHTPEIRRSGTKLTTISGAPERGICGGKRKRGTGRGEKKRSPAPPCSAVRGGDFLRGPGKSEAPRAPKRTLFWPSLPLKLSGQTLCILQTVSVFRVSIFEFFCLLLPIRK